jgi:hypothetical protein
MRRFVVVVFAASVAVAGCSSDSSGPDVAAKPSPPSDEELLAEWAGEVCSSADELQSTVAGLATDIDLDVSAGLDQLPEIQEQVSANIVAVEAQIDALQTTLSDVPESSAEGEQLAGELEALIASARESGQEAIELLAKATSADNFLMAGISAAGAFAAAESAYSDANVSIELLNELRSSTSGDLGAAFSSAPAC